MISFCDRGKKGGLCAMPIEEKGLKKRMRKRKRMEEEREEDRKRGRRK